MLLAANPGLPEVGVVVATQAHRCGASIPLMPSMHVPQTSGPGRYWALLQHWATSTRGWADGSKLMVVHDNAESILSESVAAKVCGTLVLARLPLRGVRPCVTPGFVGTAVVP